MMKDLSVDNIVDQIYLQFPALKGVEFDEQSLIDTIKKGSLISVGKDANILDIGSEEFKVFYLVSGVVKHSFRNEETKEDVAINLSSSGQLVFGGWENEFVGTPSEVGIKAVTDCVLIDVNTSDLKEFFAQNPEIKNSYHKVVNKVMGTIILTLKSRINRKPEDHYLYVMNQCKMREVYGKIPDKVMSEVLGITPVSFSRLKKRLGAPTTV